MKRICLMLALLVGVANFSIFNFQFSISRVAAQDFAYEFAMPDGTIVPDGSVLTITKAEEADDGSGDILMNSGLYAKNVDGDAEDLVRIAYTVQTMESGNMQICFPSACKNINAPSTGATNPGTMPSALHSISTEWFPVEYGKCTVKMNLETVVKTVDGYTAIDDGPAITLQFIYADPASVNAAVSVATPVAYYAISGQRLPAKPHGLALVRLSNGKVVKRIFR